MHRSGASVFVRAANDKLLGTFIDFYFDLGLQGQGQFPFGAFDVDFFAGYGDFDAAEDGNRFVSDARHFYSRMIKAKLRTCGNGLPNLTNDFSAKFFLAGFTIADDAFTGAKD